MALIISLCYSPTILPISFIISFILQFFYYSSLRRAFFQASIFCWNVISLSKSQLCRSDTYLSSQLSFLLCLFTLQFQFQNSVLVFLLAFSLYRWTKEREQEARFTNSSISLLFLSNSLAARFHSSLILFLEAGSLYSFDRPSIISRMFSIYFYNESVCTLMKAVCSLMANRMSPPSNSLSFCLCSSLFLYFKAFTLFSHQSNFFLYYLDCFFPFPANKLSYKLFIQIQQKDIIIISFLYSINHSKSRDFPLYRQQLILGLINIFYNLIKAKQSSMKNNKSMKGTFVDQRFNSSQLNLLKAQLKSKLQQIGIIFKEKPKDVLSYKNTMVMRDRIHKKFQFLPNMQSLKSKEFLSDEFKDKLEPKYPEIFSYRVQKGTKNNSSQAQKLKNNINASLQKIEGGSPRSFRECIRKKILRDARNQCLQSQSISMARNLSRQKLRFSGIQQHSIIVKKIKDNVMKYEQPNDVAQLSQEIKKINLRIRAKTQENKQKVGSQKLIEKQRKMKSTFYRDITPWHHINTLDRQYQQFF